MLAKVYSSTVVGIDAYEVEVQVDQGPGMLPFAMVGLPDASVRESIDRVASAIRNSGYYFYMKSLTINLAPAELKKEGASLDLPMAIGFLAATKQIRPPDIEQYCITGELGLDGSVRGVFGVLSMTMAARKTGRAQMIVPAHNANEAAVVDGITVRPVRNLAEAISAVCGKDEVPHHTVDLGAIFETRCQYPLDFQDVRGQNHVKRALEVAAAGGHNILMVGPPGSGKTMLAKRIPTVLPKMTLEEALETTKIHSIAGMMESDKSLIATRPFRAPHHTLSGVAMCGGGMSPKPGEVSLAHHGVLFLDELPEFHRDVLEVLRQPIEDGMVNVSRASYNVSYPARFMLACAMNPCPCGNLTDPRKTCKCTPYQVQRYRSRISGPLLDRIDIQVDVPAVKYQELAARGATGESSETVRGRVQTARETQLARFKAEKIFCNAHMSSRQIREYCDTDKAGQNLLKMAITQMGFSARAYDRILKVARTIADLEDTEKIASHHISEAIQYRTLDQEQRN